jgi:hypothetical protein
MEQWPFDGAVIFARGRRPDGQWFDARRIFTTNHWDRAWFNEALTDLKAVHSTKLTDNFLICSANPGDVDWFNDAGWNEIEAHWEILAWLAHEGGLKGIVFDPEAYTPPSKQFRFSCQAKRDAHSFDQYSSKARQRGRAVMSRVASQFPDLVLFNYFLFADCTRALGQGAQPQIELAGCEYGLLPAFADGWLDALPASATLVDGNERAYHFNDQGAFDAAFVQIKIEGQSLISLENRAKLRALLQVSHGIYLDQHLPEPSNRSSQAKSQSAKINRLEDNLVSALHASDEYVWVYGQKGRWWPPRELKASAVATWPDLVPGVVLAIANSRDPVDWAQRELATLRGHGSMTNLLRNGEFAANNQNLTHWSWWQEAGWEGGQYRLDPDAGASSKGSACFRGIQHGCLVQSVPVAPGDYFLLAVKVRQSGTGAAWLMGRWETKDGEAMAESRNVRSTLRPGSDSAAWHELVVGAHAPEGAARLIVRLGASGQQTLSDSIWFDDALVVQVDDGTARN